MVKKVIDIFPPEKQPAVQNSGVEEPSLKYSQYPEDQNNDLPQTPPLEKPKMTYVSHREEKPAPISGEKKNPFKGLLLKAGIVVVLMLALMYGLDIKFAKAVIRIWPATSDMRQEVKIAVDPAITSIDKSKNAIPGLMVSIEQTIKGQSPVTGKKDVQGRATGMVKIINGYSTEQKLVKGTRLQAPLEKFQPALAKDETPWFKTEEDVVIPAKSSVSVKVTASFPGEKYNIEPTVFSIPGLAGTEKYTFVTGQSFEKFQGGTEGSSFDVKKEDLENAKTEIVALAKSEIQKALEAKAKEQGLEVISPDAEKLEFGEAKILAKMGDSVPKVSTEMAAKASTVAYKKSDLDAYGKNFILSQVALGSVANEQSLEMNSSYAGVDPTTGKQTLSLIAKVMVYSGMPEEDLKKGLSEKGVSEAKIFLMNQPGMKDVKIEVTPFWRLNIPRQLDRIEVQTILE